MSDDSILEGLANLYRTQDLFLRQRYQRSLPFQDSLFDRWERANDLGFGPDTSIYNSAIVFGQVHVGSSTWIGPNTLLDGSGGSLVIGSFCSISSGVHIYTHDTVLWALSGGLCPRKEGSVRIGDRVYIGSQSVIALGTTIGSQCVIAANSFVNSDVPDRSIVGGSPASLIGKVVGDDKSIQLKFISRTNPNH